MDNTVMEERSAPLTHRLRQFIELPGPRSVPVFGNALQINTSRMHLQLEEWCREFGPFYKLRLGKRKIVVVGDHEAVAAILRNRPDGFRRTTRLDEIWTEMGLMPGLFGANGDAWRRQRRMVMAGFDPAHVKRYFPSLQQVAQRLHGRWHSAASQGKAIDLQADLMRFTVDTIAGLAFGAEVNTLESDQDVIQQHLNKIFPAVFKRLFATVPIWRYVHSTADRQLARSIAEIKVAVTGFIAQARARLQSNPTLREQPGNLLEAMIVAADQADSGMDDAQVAGNVLTLLLAGEDTTANTLAWMIHLLWRNPASLALATEEVRRVCGDTVAPTLAQIDQLLYIEACAHETMRLKPVAPLLPLQALSDTVIGDVQVPAGMVVISLMRRDAVSETHVPRAAAFEPERWLPDESPDQAAHAAKRISMPFGAGPRICPGRYLALLEMKMVMATLLGHFDIEGVDTPDGGQAREHLSFTMAPVGLRMRLRNRVLQPVDA
ncbi:cytochrome P450 [Rhodoferax ferrireducens]|uniref:cytochrome P450 n=1 Tax=Rhodoferax ferrireducens TaxID=192843 RepID=UPI000E0D8DA2|nr:cytochrome P450 [Rhodoferax ferrireducens]